MKLSEFLRQGDIAQAEFAERVGVSTSALNRYVLGQRTPPLEVATRIVKETKGKVKIEDLIVAEASP